MENPKNPDGKLLTERQWRIVENCAGLTSGVMFAILVMSVIFAVGKGLFDLAVHRNILDDQAPWFSLMVGWSLLIQACVLYAIARSIAYRKTDGLYANGRYYKYPKRLPE